MQIAVLIAALLSFIVGVSARNLPQGMRKPTPTPTVSSISPSPYVTEISSIPSAAPTDSAQPKTVTLSPTITVKSVIITTPTPTIKSAVYSTVTPTPTTRIITATPTPAGDTAAPTLDWMTGPTDGLTVSFNSFCFPMKYSDASSPIMVRYAFDSDTLGDWNQNYAPCYQNVANGSHSFSVQAKDAKGNQSSTIKRTFTVQVSLPTSVPIASQTPVTTQ